MKQNLQPCKPNWIHPHRIFRWIRHAAAGLALTAGMAGISQAAIVNVTGTFTSFTSYMNNDRISYVNGTTALTSSGVEVFPGRFLSDTVSFPAGTTSIDFNYDRSVTPWLVNSFEFIPAAPADVTLGQTFQLGTFRYTNGQWWEQTDIGFVLTTESSDPALNGHTFAGTLRLISTSPPNPDPYAQADYFWVLERPDLGSMRVFELYYQPPGNPGNVGDFAINGRIDSLVLTGFDALNGAGFTDASIQPGLSGPGSSVPEPGTLTLLGIGIGVFAGGGVLRRKTGGQEGNRLALE